MALPFVFVTKELHAISPATVERSQTTTTGPLTKLYWSAHVEELKREFFNVKAMGSATAEEWLKGLEGRGIERRNDASKWEKWATVYGGLKQMRSVLYPGYQTPAAMSNRVAAISTGVASYVGRIPGISNSNNNSPAAASPVASSQRNDMTPDPFRRASSGTMSYPAGRHEKTWEEVAELKAARKAEIERRALALDPPLPAHVLAHIPAFQAALQIATPMDDQGWDVLKPRLMSQRADAEQRDRESSTRVKQELDERRNLNAVTKDARDAKDGEDPDWDDAQAPVRARIAGYADEIIRDGWDDGEKINRDNCAKFAVEALVYIRKRFYAEIAKDAAAARAAGKSPIVDPPQGPFTQKLTLENMKWIFDVKVRPLTERYRKEIFLCNGCDVTVRSYGFEGVIQHYSAKHTNALSIGSVVVHWRAEWPEHPPFTWEPKTSKGQHQNQTTPATYNAQPSGPPPPFQPPVAGPAPGYAPYPGTIGGYAPHQGYGATPYPPMNAYQPYAPAPAQQTGYVGPAQPPAGAPYQIGYGGYHNNAQVGYQSVQPSHPAAQYSVQLDDMAHMARDLWNATGNMKDTLSIVRVQVVVFHLAKRFHAKFGIPLPLPTFVDGLSNHKDMRPVRNVNGLVCRVCHLAIGGYVASEEERKSWSLPQLTAHFLAKHIEPFVQMGQYGQPPEWTVDMVLLPEPAAVSNLRAVIGMDGQKYHLVNEAIPHLLQEAPSMPHHAAQDTSAWHDQTSHYQGYQGVAHDNSGASYGQAHTDVLSQAAPAGQYASTFGSTQQSTSEQTFTPNHAEPYVVSNTAVPLAGTYLAPEPAPAMQGSGAGSRSDSGRKSNQGHSRRQKNRKKGNNRESIDEEARRRTEEEEKMAEEEAEREADVIRAMWAADRAVTATKTVFPEGQQVGSGNQGKVNNSGNTSKPVPKPNTPKQNQRFQSRPPRNSPRRDDTASPLRVSVPNSQLEPIVAPQPQQDIAYRGHQLSNVIYADGHRDEPPRQELQRTPDARDRYGPPLPNIGRPRSRSPMYQERMRPIPPTQYRQRSPPHQQPEQSLYQTRLPVPVGEVQYEPEPLSRNDYADYGPPGPAPGLIEWEIIEYRNPDGSITVQERELRRIPNSEAEHYYRNAPPPASAPYDRRGELQRLSPSPYRRDQQAPPAAAGEPYYPPYDRAYSRAPEPHPPLRQVGEPEAYDPRYPADAPMQRNGPMAELPRVQPMYYQDEEYDPRFPNGPPAMAGPASRPTYR